MSTTIRLELDDRTGPAFDRFDRRLDQTRRNASELEAQLDQLSDHAEVSRPEATPSASDAPLPTDNIGFPSDSLPPLFSQVSHGSRNVAAATQALTSELRGFLIEEARLHEFELQQINSLRILIQQLAERLFATTGTAASPPRTTLQTSPR